MMANPQRTRLFASVTLLAIPLLLLICGCAGGLMVDGKMYYNENEAYEACKRQCRDNAFHAQALTAPLAGEVVIVIPTRSAIAQIQKRQSGSHIPEQHIHWTSLASCAYAESFAEFVGSTGVFERTVVVHSDQYPDFDVPPNAADWQWIILGFGSISARRAVDGREWAFHQRLGDSDNLGRQLVVWLESVVTEAAQPPASARCNFDTLKVPAHTASVAVLDFGGGDDVSPEIGQVLADYCRQAIRECQCMTIVDRESMRAILSEEDFAATFECDDTRCLVDFGRKLRAQKIVHGRITRVGKSYVLSIRLVDVGSTAVQAIQNERVVGSPEALLDVVEQTTCRLLHQALDTAAD